MKLSAPKQATWWIALLAGVLGIVGKYVALGVISENKFWFVVVGFILLVIGTLLPGF
jgi:hypothetical protein